VTARKLFPLLLALLTVDGLNAADYFAAPSGKSSGDGSKTQPWDLATALAGPAKVQPGDTIWLRGGTYTGEFTSRLKGTKDAPITIRQAFGERSTIDLVTKDRTALLDVEGEYVRFWGFEVTCSHPIRISKSGGPFAGPDIRRGSIHCRASHVSFINLVVHDLGVGFGFWSEGEAGEVYGCLIFNNGWKAPDRGHGHGIYTQNVKGTKRLVDNVLFNQFSHGIHAYGSAKARIEGFHIEGNAAFNNGVLAGPEDLAPNILVGGGAPARRITLARNFTYHSKPATSVRLGYGAVNDDLTLTENYFAGYTEVRFWKTVTAKGNTFLGADSLVRLESPRGVALPGYAWDGNTYRSSRQKYSPLVAVQDGKSLANNWQEWKKAGLDASGSHAEGKLSGVKVFVRPNLYEPGRAHVIAYNWDRSESVPVKLEGVLKEGQKYRLVSVHDYFGDPVLTGVYDGKPVSVPMRPIHPPPGVGMENAPISTAPEFDVFVVLSD
jgi:hypothetical protein